ncbi:hypothetical protein PROFUN_10278 [Planoprotostelium fungivorum]|uniref:Uncharacterized protein n=1 Tax=Planoprotostelium fungivorum TaxID=1890364 RepID=A0A2P6MRP4_9EUKA|nr:hypothetical protein PROFUN_10278 [Planoprotostelium fungivorum]
MLNNIEPEYEFDAPMSCDFNALHAESLPVDDWFEQRALVLNNRDETPQGPKPRPVSQITRSATKVTTKTSATTMKSATTTKSSTTRATTVKATAVKPTTLKSNTRPPVAPPKKEVTSKPAVKKSATIVKPPAIKKSTTLTAKLPSSNLTSIVKNVKPKVETRRPAGELRTMQKTLSTKITQATTKTTTRVAVNTVKTSTSIRPAPIITKTATTTSKTLFRKTDVKQVEKKATIGARSTLKDTKHRVITVPKSPQFATSRRRLRAPAESTEERQLKEMEATRALRNLKSGKRSGTTLVSPKATKRATLKTVNRVYSLDSSSLMKTDEPPKDKTKSVVISDADGITSPPRPVVNEVPPLPSDGDEWSESDEEEPQKRQAYATASDKFRVKGSSYRQTNRLHVNMKKSSSSRESVSKIVAHIAGLTNPNDVEKRARDCLARMPKDSPKMFKARPLRPSILHGPPSGIPIMPPAKLTIPTSPVFNTKTRSLLHQTLNHNAISVVKMQSRGLSVLSNGCTLGSPTRCKGEEKRAEGVENEPHSPEARRQLSRTMPVLSMNSPQSPSAQAKRLRLL